MYLFETILLCCKNIDINKPKNKLYAKNLTDPKGKPKLQLKGRIFMQNVTDLVSLAKPGMGDYHLSCRSSERVRLNKADGCGFRLIHMSDFLEGRPEY